MADTDALSESARRRIESRIRPTSSAGNAAGGGAGVGGGMRQRPSSALGISRNELGDDDGSVANEEEPQPGPSVRSRPQTAVGAGVFDGRRPRGGISGGGPRGRGRGGPVLPAIHGSGRSVSAGVPSSSASSAAGAGGGSGGGATPSQQQGEIPPTTTHSESDEDGGSGPNGGPAVEGGGVGDGRGVGRREPPVPSPGGRTGGVGGGGGLSSGVASNSPLPPISPSGPISFSVGQKAPIQIGSSDLLAPVEDKRKVHLPADPRPPAPVSVPSTQRASDSSGTAFVQNPITGAFKKSTPVSGTTATATVITALPSLTRNLVDTVASVIAACLVFAQGTLGGFALLNLIISLAVGGSTADFLSYYSPIANYSRGIYFFFSIVCILATVDKYAKDQMQSFYGVVLRKYLDAFLVGLYLLVFLCCLINAHMDELMYYSYLRIPNWYREGYLDDSFERALASWRVFNFIRCIASILAWALVCVETQPYEFNSSNRQAFLEERRRAQHRLRHAAVRPSA